MKWLSNPRRSQGPAPEGAGGIGFGREIVDRACREIAAWPDYTPTPLHSLDDLADELGLARIYYKDESGRFGLGSFKALGGPYAISRQEGLSPDIAFASATDGNHGRAVAWGAGRVGCRSVVYLHEHVSRGREEAIASYGARTVRVSGTYEDSLRRMRADAAANGWRVISDAAGAKDHDEVQILIMAAYGLIADEAVRQLPGDAWPTHVFVQGGVGGLCTGVFMRLWQLSSGEHPAFVVVEPDRADCLYRSAEAGAPTIVPGSLDTVMACLAAGEVSYPAWMLLDRAVDHFLSIPDDWAPAAMRRLAEGRSGDPRIAAGESGCAGLAGLMAVLGDDTARNGIGLQRDSSVLLIGSEGATDPEIYRSIVGCAPEDVAPAANVP